MDPIANLATAFDVAYGVIKNVPADQWTSASPCTEWDARAVLNHVIGGAKMIATCVSGQTFDHASVAGDLGGADPAATYRAAADAALAAFKADPSVLGRPVTMPFGEMPGAVVASLFVSDHFGHAWDIAKATGQSTDLAPEFAEGVLAGAKMFISADLRKPGFFDAEKPAPAGASAADRLAAFMGRQV